MTGHPKKGWRSDEEHVKHFSTICWEDVGPPGSTWVHLKWAKFSSDSLVEEFSKTAREHLYSWVLAS